MQFSKPQPWKETLLPNLEDFFEQITTTKRDIALLHTRHSCLGKVEQTSSEDTLLMENRRGVGGEESLVIETADELNGKATTFHNSSRPCVRAPVCERKTVTMSRNR